MVQKGETFSTFFIKGRGNLYSVGWTRTRPLRVVGGQLLSPSLKSLKECASNKYLLLYVITFRHCHAFFIENGTAFYARRYPQLISLDLKWIGIYIGKGLGGGGGVSSRG